MNHETGLEIVEQEDSFFSTLVNLYKVHCLKEKASRIFSNESCTPTACYCSVLTICRP